MKKILFIILVLLSFCVSGFAQGDEQLLVGIEVSIESNISGEGQVSGELPLYNIYRKDHQFIVNLKRPELSLVFESDIKLELERTNSVVEILDSHWKKALEHFYESEIGGFSDALEQSKADTKWEQLNGLDIARIRSHLIKSPDMTRNISEYEATEMIKFLNTVAKDLVTEARDFKGTYTAFKLKRKSFPSARNYCGMSRGTTTLKVTFDKSATVTAVEVVSPSGCESFDKSSIKAARKIKFNPLTINGNPRTIVKWMQFHFTTN